LRTTSNLLLELARSLENGFPESQDSEMDFPAEVQPITELRRPMDVNPVTTATTVQNGSFGVSATALVNNGGGAITSTVATVGKGYWEFDVTGSYTSNYQDVNGGAESRLTLNINGNTSFLLAFRAGGSAANPQAQCMNRKVRILLPQTSTVIQVQANNNGAGELQNVVFHLYAHKLL